MWIPALNSSFKMTEKISTVLAKIEMDKFFDYFFNFIVRATELHDTYGNHISKIFR